MAQGPALFHAMSQSFPVQPTLTSQPSTNLLQEDSQKFNRKETVNFDDVLSETYFSSIDSIGWMFSVFAVVSATSQRCPFEILAQFVSGTLLSILSMIMHDPLESVRLDMT